MARGIRKASLPKHLHRCAPLARGLVYMQATIRQGGHNMKPVAAVVAAAVISGTAMYVAGARTASVDAFNAEPTVTMPAGQLVRAVPVNPGSSLRPAAVSSSPRRTSTARVEQVDEAISAPNRAVVREDESDRSWSKAALIIGGSAASGAGVGAVVNGKKGALIGAAIGGGAASIYEATQRR